VRVAEWRKTNSPMPATTNSNTDVTDLMAPHLGSKSIPRWNLGELPQPPAFGGRNLATMLGPRLAEASGLLGQ